MSYRSGQSMNYLTPPRPYSNTGSVRSCDSNYSLSTSSTCGEVHVNAAYDYADSSGVSSSSSHDYEDLQSVMTEAKSISGPRKKTNDLYESTRPLPHRVRQITECSDDSTSSSVSSDVLPVKRDTCLSKLILFLILAFSVAALVLVILIISGKLGPKCGCRDREENQLPSPSAEKSFSVQSLLGRIQDLESNMLAMKEKMEARNRAVEIFVTKYENQMELLEAQVSSQNRIINETANKVAVVDGVRVNMSSIHQAFEKKLETEFRLLNKSVRALNKNDSELTSTINELRQSQILTRRISKRLAVNVTELESRVQELKTSSSNMSIRAGRLEKGYTQMNTLMKTLEDVNDAQNASSDNLRSLYVSLRDSLASVNATMNEKLKNLVSSGGKGGADFNTCQHKRIPGTRGSVTGGNGAAAFSDAPYTVPSNKRVMGITCSTDYAQDYKLLSPRQNYYECACRGVSPTAASSNPSSIQCFLHVWECTASSS